MRMSKTIYCFRFGQKILEHDSTNVEAKEIMEQFGGQKKEMPPSITDSSIRLDWIWKIHRGHLVKPVMYPPWKIFRMYLPQEQLNVYIFLEKILSIDSFIILSIFMFSIFNSTINHLFANILHFIKHLTTLLQILRKIIDNVFGSTAISLPIFSRN